MYFNYIGNIFNAISLAHCACDDPYPVNNFTGVISLLKTYISTIYTAPGIKSNSLLVVYHNLSLVAAGGYGKIESSHRACYMCEDDWGPVRDKI